MPVTFSARVTPTLSGQRVAVPTPVVNPLLPAAYVSDNRHHKNQELRV